VNDVAVMISQPLQVAGTRLSAVTRQWLNASWKQSLKASMRRTTTFSSGCMPRT